MKTVRSIRGLAFAGVAALGLIAMTPAMADSDFVQGGGTISANADLDFRVNVPRFIDFRVGSAGNTVDTVTFNVAAANVGDGSAVSAGAPIEVALRSNAGNLTLAANSATAGLTATGLDPIAWSEIVANSSNGNLPVPTVGGSVNLSAANGVINRTADWSFDYSNSALVGAGTYEGTVTYTASTP